VIIQLEISDVVSFGTHKEPQAPIDRAFVKREQLSGQVDADIVVLFLVFGLSTPTFEVVLKGVIPVDSGVTEDLAGAFVEPGGEFFVFELRVLLVDGRVKSNHVEMASDSLMVTVFLTLAIPDHTSTPKPLTQNESLEWCGQSLESNPHQHNLQLLQMACHLTLARRGVKSMQEKDDWRTGRSCVYKIFYHLVFVTKYRGGALSEEMLVRLEEIYQETCEQMGGELLAFSGEADHVHLMVSAPPKTALSNLIGKLNGKSSYVLRS